MAGLPQRGDRSLRAAALTQTEMAAFIWPRRALVVYLFALAFVLNILGLLLAGLPADNCTSVSDFPICVGVTFPYATVGTAMCIAAVVIVLLTIGVAVTDLFIRIRTDPMAVPLSLIETVNVCRIAAGRTGWRIAEVRREPPADGTGAAIVECRTRAGSWFPRFVLYNPPRISIELAADHPTMTQMTLEGAIVGYGPIQRGYLKRRMRALEQAITASIPHDDR